MKIGYARISMPSQNINMQIDALKKEGCEKIFQDIGTGSRKERPGLEEALEYVRNSDMLVVWKLDRLGRSVNHLIATVNMLNKKGIGFKSLQEHIDTTTNGGKLIFHIFCALAEFERELIVERTMVGLEAARARGRLGGRPFKLSINQTKRLRQLYDAKVNTIQEICNQFDINKTTMYKYLKRDIKKKKKKNKKKAGDKK